MVYVFVKHRAIPNRSKLSGFLPIFIRVFQNEAENLLKLNGKRHILNLVNPLIGALGELEENKITTFTNGKNHP